MEPRKFPETGRFVGVAETRRLSPMTDGTYYRNRETGIVQAHPTSGLGESLNSDEIGQDGKPVKPVIPLGASDDEIKRLKNLAKGSKTPEATTGTGSAKKQEGDQ